MARQLQQASTRARVVVIGVVGAVGFAAVYFFHPEHGAGRRQEAYTWLEDRARRVWTRSQRLTRPTAVVAEAPAADPQPADLAEALAREVAYVTVAPPAPEEPVAVTVTARESASPEAAVSGAGVGESRVSTAETRVSFLHPEAAKPAKFISYDAGRPAVPREEIPESRATSAAWAGATRRSRVRLALAASSALLLGVGVAALGAWTVWPDGDEAVETAQPSGAADAVQLISQPGARSLPVEGSKGTMVLVVAPSGEAVLVISGLTAAPAGKEYQAWVVTGGKPKSAGLFKGGATRLVVPLNRRVPKGAVVAVTLERAGGVPAPTQTPRFVAKLT